MAASAETGFPSWGLTENGRTSHVSPIMVAPAEFSSFDGTQEQPSQEDSQSVTSSLSCPTRGWVSAAGSVMDDAVMAIDGRARVCHLCFNTGHFLMECPLLGSDVRQAAHRQRYLKHPKGPSWKTSSYLLRDALSPCLRVIRRRIVSMTPVARQLPFNLWWGIPIRVGKRRHVPFRRRKTSR